MAGSVIPGTVKPIFESLSYGPALEGESLVKAWLSKHSKQFGFFVDGNWNVPKGRETIETRNVFSGEILASTSVAIDSDVKSIILSSMKAFDNWSNTSHHVQSSHLYSIARNLQKHQSLLAILEAVNTGRLAKDTRSIDVPAAIRSFYHYAGWASVKGEELAAWKPVGVVAIIVDDSCPVLQMSIRIAAALAMGNVVIVHPPTSQPLSALLIAEICAQAGLPPGVLNVATGETTAKLLASDVDVDCISYAGSEQIAKLLRQVSAGRTTKMSLELQGKNPIIILEDADIDSAVEGIVESAFSGAGQPNTCGSRLLIQESVFKKVTTKLKARMSKMTVGNNLDKNTDVGPLSDPKVVTTARAMIFEAKKEGAEVHQACSEPEGSKFLAPTLITNEQTSSLLYTSNLPAPILLAVPFRTLQEGVNIANHSLYGMSASIWTENISVALECASLLYTGTVWINGQNFRDAAACVGGNKSSGYGRMGGKEGLLEFAQPLFCTKHQVTMNQPLEIMKFGTSGEASSLLPDSEASLNETEPSSIDKTYKMFYGGAQKRADSNAYRAVTGSGGQVYAYVPDGGKKDVRNAVDAALKGLGWKKKEGHGKAQILYYMAENLQSKRNEIVSQLCVVSNKSDTDATAEFETSIQRLFYWAAWCDKHGGSVEETGLYGMTFKMNQPVGVIGIVCPDNYPLLAFVSLVAPAIARGNTVIVVPSEKNPIPGLAFHQILETSDVPAGVVNILSGNTDILTRTLSEHHDVRALWYFGQSRVGSHFVEHSSVENFKRVWVNQGRSRDWAAAEQGQGEEFLYHCTNPKTVWIPMGDVFAN